MRRSLCVQRIAAAILDHNTVSVQVLVVAQGVYKHGTAFLPLFYETSPPGSKAFVVMSSLLSIFGIWQRAIVITSLSIIAGVVVFVRL